MSIAVGDLLRLGLGEIGAARAGETLSPDDAADALLLFNEYLDLLNSNDRALYNVAFAAFTLTPSHQPHSIGLSANAPDFAVTVGRPTKITGGAIILPNNIRAPFTRLNGEVGLLDANEWASIRAGAATGQTPTITSAIPQHLYYSPDWPNGNCYLYPVPSSAYQIELQTQTLLGSMLATDTLDLPFGYQSALRLSFAEYCANQWGQPIGPDLARRAANARAQVWGTDAIPLLRTRDAGMPGGSGSGGFDYRTGRNA